MSPICLIGLIIYGFFEEELYLHKPTMMLRYLFGTMMSNCHSIMVPIMCVGDTWFAFHVLYFNFYWLYLHNENCVALMSIRWSINKDEIERWTSQYLVMVIRSTCWLLSSIHRYSQMCLIFECEDNSWSLKTQFIII